MSQGLITRQEFFIVSLPLFLLQSLLVMKHNEMLTDVKLEVVNEVFHAHRVILAAASPYFKGKI